MIIRMRTRQVLQEKSLPLSLRVELDSGELAKPTKVLDLGTFLTMTELDYALICFSNGLIMQVYRCPILGAWRFEKDQRSTVARGLVYKVESVEDLRVNNDEHIDTDVVVFELPEGVWCCLAHPNELAHLSWTEMQADPIPPKDIH